MEPGKGFQGQVELETRVEPWADFQFPAKAKLNDGRTKSI